MYTILQMNDWNYRRLFVFIFSVQLSLICNIILNSMNIDIPIIGYLRPVIGFFYLVYIPGILILRLFKLHYLGVTKTLLYAICFSISTLMFVGFFVNYVYPLIGITKPISLYPLFITINIVVMILCILCYATDPYFQSHLKSENYFSLPTILFGLYIPTLSVAGVYLVNFHQSNILLLIMNLVLVLVILFVGFDIFISSKAYPMFIWVIAISLILCNTLISQYIVVGDVVTEFYYTNLVVENSFWNWNFFNSYNAVLSNVILGPFFYYICNLDLTWIFKIFYPLLYSFSSLGVYYIFINESKSEKIAFFSSLLFISVMPFFSQIPTITKQAVAEIFLVSFFLTLLDHKLGSVQRPLLLIIFSLSLIVSHYATSYLIMTSLFFVFVFLSFANNKIIGKLFDTSFFNPFKNFLISKFEVQNSISFNFLLLFFIFTFGWYIYISNSVSFNTLVSFVNHVSSTLVSGFLDPESSRGLFLITRSEASITRTSLKISYLITQFWILLGLIKSIYGYEKIKFQKIYLAFSLFFLVVLFAAVVVSGFSLMDPRRLYHLSLILLAPFSIIGSLVFFGWIHKIFQPRMDSSPRKLFQMLSIFFSIFLMLNTGFVSEILSDHPFSISLSKQKITECGSIKDKADFYGKYIMTQNVYSGKWLGSYKTNNVPIYTGEWVSGYPALSIYGGINPNIKTIDNEKENIDTGYIQLSYLNVIEGKGTNWYNDLQIRLIYDFDEVAYLLKDKSKIYNNGGSEILFSTTL